MWVGSLGCMGVGSRGYGFGLRVYGLALGCMVWALGCIGGGEDRLWPRLIEGQMTLLSISAYWFFTRLGISSSLVRLESVSCVPYLPENYLPSEKRIERHTVWKI